MKHKFKKTITKIIHVEKGDPTCGATCEWPVDQGTTFFCTYFEAPLDCTEDDFLQLRCSACLQQFKMME